MRVLATSFSMATSVLAALLLPAMVRAELPDPPAIPSDEDVAGAREHFVRGMVLAGDERWNEALEQFVRSYSLSGSPVALFNVGSTLRALGRFREAREAFDRLLADPELDAATRASAEALRAEVAPQIARVWIADVPPDASRLLADGAERALGEERPVELELDPGHRTLSVEAPARARWEWAGTLDPGARLHLGARFDPLPSGGGEAALGWALGIGAALVIGAIVGFVVADAEAQLDPRTRAVITLP